MENDHADVVTWTRMLADESETRALAHELAQYLGANDLLTLSGELGSGKTTFARYLIRKFLGNDLLEVPSPTFTIMQVYEGLHFPVVHADLYRIEKPDELAELGWDEASDGALVLVEWVENAGAPPPPDRLDIRFKSGPDTNDTRRIVDVAGYGAFASRVARARAIHDLLAGCGWLEASREFMQGDASSRAYERLIGRDGSAILMISPARVDDPTLQFTTPYSTIAHLAENIRPFLAVDQALRDQGFSAPRIIGMDIEHGLAVLEDFGREGVTENDAPIADRYREAVSTLAALHSINLPDVIPEPSGGRYKIPRYDLRAYQAEIELIVDWYAAETPASHYDSVSRIRFLELWAGPLRALDGDPPTWTLRDYHSPNLIWLPDRAGLDRVGLLDFQDCVMGHPAYDVVSLLQDARITVPNDLEIKLLSHYANRRRAVDASFDMARFARAYALLGAQRASKILGIFSRLDKRDLKPQYLRHIPRVERYLAKNLAHPALSEIAGWYRTNIPDIFVA